MELKINLFTKVFFVSFVAISSVKCRCFKGTSLVEFYPDRASLMYGLSAKKVAIPERWALVEVWLYNVLTFVANKIMYPREKIILSHRN